MPGMPVTYALLDSAARTATTNSEDHGDPAILGGVFTLNVTAVAGSASLVARLQGKDPASGTYYDILVSPAVTATGITVLKVHPGIGALANGAANDILPNVWRVRVEAATADSATYSVGVQLKDQG